MKRKLNYNEEALMKLKIGSEKILKVIKLTHGPGGRRMDIEDSGSHLIARIGTTFTEKVELSDPYENIGARMVLHAMKMTGEKAGDGSTTSAIIADKLLAEGINMLFLGIDPVDLEGGIKQAHNIAMKELYDLARPVKSPDDLYNIASRIVIDDQELSNLLTRSFVNKGPQALVQVRPGTGLDTTLSFVDGFEFECVRLSPSLINGSTMLKTELDDALVFITKDKITSATQLLPMLVKIVDSKKPLLLIARDFATDAVTLIENNNRNKVINCIAVKPLMNGEQVIDLLEDIAVVCNTELFSGDIAQNLKLISINQLGKVDRVIATLDTTTILASKLSGSKRLKACIDLLKEKRESIKLNNAEINAIDYRISRLSTGVAVLTIGGASETELKEKLQLAERVVMTIKSALKEGVIAGGGKVWLSLLKKLETIEINELDESRGIIAYKKTLSAPFIELQSNEGIDPLPLMEKSMNAGNGSGYDLQKGANINIWEDGLLEPVRVAGIALESAVSVVTELLQEVVMIAETNNKNEHSMI